MMPCKSISRGKFLLGLPFLLVAAVAFGQQLKFPRESIQFTLDRQHFTVSGYYYFCGSAGTFPIMYPFPNGSKVVDSAVVKDCISLADVPFKTMSDGLVFSLNRPSTDTTVLQIYYREKLAGHKATYILTTTRAWGRSLEHATYSLLVAPGVKVTSLSVTPDSKMDTGLGTLYFFTRRDFMPTTDFVVEFE